MPVPSCLRLFAQKACDAFCFAAERTGNKIAARIAIMAMTTSSSINVNAFFFIVHCRYWDNTTDGFCLGRLLRHTTGQAGCNSLMYQMRPELHLGCAAR